MFLVPAVVVGHHRQGGVGNLGFPGQAGFGVIGHADHFAVPGAVELRFGPGGEGRPLHAEIGAAAVQLAALGHQAFGYIGQQAAERRAEGLGKSHMGYQPLTKQRQWPLLGAIDELVRHQHVEGPNPLLQGAHRRQGQDPAHAEGAQGPEVGLVGHLGGGVAVVAAMTGQEHHLQIADTAQAQGIGGGSVGRFDRELLNVFEALHGVETAAPQDPKAGAAEIDAVRGVGGGAAHRRRGLATGR